MEFKYLTNTEGTGGRIKELPQDFIVEEIGDTYSTSVNYLPDKKVDEIDWKEVFDKREDKDFLIVDFEKINLSTTNAINQFARFMHMSKKRFSYAGLKDKRAVTSQRLSIYQPTLDRISKFYFKNIKVYNPFWSNDKVKIGDLKQNRFVITIRQIENKSKEEIENIINDTIKQIEEKGLINYFGEQRFGGAREITHRVGKLFLQRKYKEGIMLYLTEPGKFESERLTDARKDLKETLEFGRHAASFPTRTGYESAILNYLTKNPDDFLGALKILPKSIQYLFIHAYQSYLFNELINLRLEKFGSLEKIDGDKEIDGKVHLPLFGFESKFSEGTAGELEKEVLNKENITFDDFENNDYFVISSKGDWRPLMTKVYDLKLIGVLEDEISEGQMKATVSFTLDKGQYATVFIRELVKKEFIG